MTAPDLHELGRKRRALLSHLDALQPDIRAAAVEAVRRGDRKRDVAADAGVSRPTLDRWVNDWVFLSLIEEDGRLEGAAVIDPDRMKLLTGDIGAEVSRIMNEYKFVEYMLVNHGDAPRLSWRSRSLSGDQADSLKAVTSSFDVEADALLAVDKAAQDRVAKALREMGEI